MNDQKSAHESVTEHVERIPSPPPAPARRPWRWIVAVVVLGIIALLAWQQPWEQLAHSARRGGGRPTAGQAVGVAAAARGDMPVILNAIGTVTPLAAVTIKSQISGYMTDVAFTEGQIVKKGDLLARIDSRPYEAALAQYEGQLTRDQALLKNAQLDLARYQKLIKQDSISGQNVDTQAALVLQDQGIVASDQAQIDMQKLNIAYCHIVSPVAGRVGLRQVDPGNYVTPGDANGIVVIAQLQPISVLFTLPEDNLPQVMARLRAGASLTVTARDKGNTTTLATGALATVDNQIDPTTGTIKMRATFANDDGALFPNQFVNVALLVDTLKDMVLVPTAAIQHGTPGTYVYRLNADNTVSVRKVTVGQSDGSNTVVTEGLSAGDRVVIDGADRLRDGATVTIPADRNTSGQPSDKPTGRHTKPKG